jgi:hypothetical protein
MQLGPELATTYGFKNMNTVYNFFFPRRVEDAIEKKKLGLKPFSIIMENNHHGNKVTSLRYYGWIVGSDVTFDAEEKAEQNIWLQSNLAVWERNDTPIGFIPESSYIIPTCGKDSTPHSAEKRPPM